jgi:hypothetical protein
VVSKKATKGKGETLQNLTPIKRQPTKWEKAFLVALATTANVSKACELAHVTRPTVYDLRNSAEDFRRAWDEALETACDMLELEARRRAESGVNKTIFYKGEPIGTETNYSDTLMIFLLKAHRPEKYRERFDIEIKDARTRAEAAIAECMQKTGRDRAGAIELLKPYIPQISDLVHQ